MSEWQENARCRACGRRKIGGYGAFDTLCPGCGARARWAWQLWRSVIERRVGLLRRRWEPLEGPFVPDEAAHRGGFIW